MAVGDVNSDARGSGARYNDGKAPLHLIPLRAISESFEGCTSIGTQEDVKWALLDLGLFQETGDADHLHSALLSLHLRWRDCAAVFDYGRKKYAEWNWVKGMAWSIPLACAARHALAILEGEEVDPESGLPHVGHLLCNLVMLRTFVTTYPEGNDLPPARLFTTAPEPGSLDALLIERSEVHHAVEAPMPPTVDFVVHPTGQAGDFEVVPCAPRKFQVGDRVRTARTGYTFGPQTGVIVDCRDGVFEVRVDGLHPDMGDQRTWCYLCDELTLDDPSTQPLIQN